MIHVLALYPTVQVENAQLMAQHVQHAPLDTVSTTTLVFNVSILLSQEMVHVLVI
jgi:hypothetical protein